MATATEMATMTAMTKTMNKRAKAAWQQLGGSMAVAGVTARGLWLWRRWQLGGGSGSLAMAAWQWQLDSGSLGVAALTIATTTVLLPHAAVVATKTPAATVMTGAMTTMNNQLKAAAAAATETATMTVTTTTIKAKAKAAAAAGAAWIQRQRRRWQWQGQRGGSSSSAAEALRQQRWQLCDGDGSVVAEVAAAQGRVRRQLGICSFCLRTHNR